MKRSKRLSLFSSAKKVLSKLDPIVFLFVGFTLLAYALQLKGNGSALSVSGLGVPSGIVNTDLSVFNVAQPKLGAFRLCAYAEVSGGDSGESSGAGLGDFAGDVVVDYEGYPFQFEEGDVVGGTGCKFESMSPDNVYDKNYLAKGISARVACGGYRLISKSEGLAGIKWRLRKALKEFVEGQLKPPLSSLLLGMLSGDDSGMPDSFNEIMRCVGLSHIIVVSGYNVSVVYSVFDKTLRFLGRKAAAIAGLLLLMVFTWVVGPEPPVLRAVTMAAIMVVSQLAGRKVTGFRALLLGSALMLAYKPAWVNSVSFHLSFLASLAIGYTGLQTPRWLQALGWLGGFLSEFLVQTITVLLFTTPYILAVFGQFSWIAIFSNILVLPVCKAIMAFGATAIVVGAVSRIVGKALFALPWVLLWYVLFVSDRLTGISEPIQVKLAMPSMFLVYAIIAVLLFILNVLKHAKE